MPSPAAHPWPAEEPRPARLVQHDALACTLARAVQARAVAPVQPAGASGIVQRQAIDAAPRAEPARARATTAVGQALEELAASPAVSSVFALSPVGAQAIVHAMSLSAGFCAAFLPCALTLVSAEDRASLEAEFDSVLHRLAFNVGVSAGFYKGLAEDLWANLEGLYHLAALASQWSSLGVTLKILREAQALGADPDAYLAAKRRQAAAAGDAWSAALAFATRLQRDPAALLAGGEELGSAAAAELDLWFHGFMQRSSFGKGLAVGTGLGMVTMEVALLFVGPELAAARAASAAGRVARAGGRLSKVILELLEKLPELGRFSRAMDEFGAAGRALGAVAGGAADVARAGVGAASKTGVPLEMFSYGGRRIVSNRSAALSELLAEARTLDITIVSGDDAARYLNARAASHGADPASFHAVTIGDNILVRPEHAADVRVLREEFIHVLQQRRDIDPTLLADELRRRGVEIEFVGTALEESQARRIMIRFRRTFALTNAEVRDMIGEVRQIERTGRY